MDERLETVDVGLEAVDGQVEMVDAGLERVDARVEREDAGLERVDEQVEREDAGLEMGDFGVARDFYGPVCVEGAAVWVDARVARAGRRGVLELVGPPPRSPPSSPDPAPETSDPAPETLDADYVSPLSLWGGVGFIAAAMVIFVALYRWR